MGKNRVILDSGALTALAEEKENIRRIFRRAIQEQAEIAVPTAVIAESTTGTSLDAPLNRVLRVFEPEAILLNESLARDAGSIRYRAKRGTKDPIDAIVVATADAQAGSVILTGDVGDMRILAAVRQRTRVISF